MRRMVLAGLACAGALALAVACMPGQRAAASAAPYKLGTFESGGRTFVGLVVNDTLVADIGQANAAFERDNASAPKLAMPGEMKALIGRYDEIRERLGLLAGAMGAPSRPAYVQQVTALKTRPPVMYPTTMLNAAVNYAEHAAEMSRAGGAGQSIAPTTSAPESQSMPGLWERKAGDTRHNPYFFLKPPSVVIANGEAIQLPPGREKIDWECELSVVIGKTATRVPLDKATDYIFGYTLENDVSDRGGRGDRRHGSDWLIGKGHDTFAPMGPFIVPKQFVKDPQKLALTFTLNGKVMQDSNTDRMTHTAVEMVSFGSHVLTLRAGDVIALGSPAGVGTARETPIYFKAGDTAVCTIESIGTLTNPIVAAAPSPSTH
ncbi:MAG: fumarylacetoacetate hydrolase family protein [Acidobacteria bacterium]|nr:fumarylacetoacetate hydrolase family protein [Acidobacteriota bacterium]